MFLAAVAVLCVPASLQTVSISFEAFPGPDGQLGTLDDVVITAPTTFAAQTVQLTDEFVALGLRFTPNPGSNDSNEVLDSSSFVTPAAHTPPNLFASSGLNEIRGSFTVPVTRVAALIGISGGADQLEIYDANGVSLGAQVGDDVVVALSSTSVPIASFVIRPSAGTTPAIDNLEFDTQPAAPTSYCTPGTTTNGCTADISASANPSVSGATACAITVTEVEGQKNGLVFYGQTPNNIPWASGSTSTLCVKSPTQRMAALASGGTVGLCNGVLVQDWDAWQAANPNALGNPWTVGEKVYVQSWFRDPPAVKTTNLSDAIELTYLP